MPTLLDNNLLKNDAKDELAKSRRDLVNFQTRLYAHDKHAVLVCFQGMETGGKDSLIREVFNDFQRSVVNRLSLYPIKTDNYGHFQRSEPSRVL